MAVTLKQIDKRISEMENEYGYSNTWPLSYQQEYERLCAAKYAIIDKRRKARQ